MMNGPAGMSTRSITGALREGRWARTSGAARSNAAAAIGNTGRIALLVSRPCGHRPGGATTSPVRALRMLPLALALLGCAAPSRAVRDAVRRGDVPAALRAYERFVEDRGDGDAEPARRHRPRHPAPHGAERRARRPRLGLRGPARRGRARRRHPRAPGPHRGRRGRPRGPHALGGPGARGPRPRAPPRGAAQRRPRAPAARHRRAAPRPRAPRPAPPARRRRRRRARRRRAAPRDACVTRRSPTPCAPTCATTPTTTCARGACAASRGATRSPRSSAPPSQTALPSCAWPCPRPSRRARGRPSGRPWRGCWRGRPRRSGWRPRGPSRRGETRARRSTSWP